MVKKDRSKIIPRKNKIVRKFDVKKIWSKNLGHIFFVEIILGQKNFGTEKFGTIFFYHKISFGSKIFFGKRCGPKKFGPKNMIK